jgi:DNA primase
VIPAAFVQDLLQRVDVAEVVGRHVALRKAGINLKGLCPFHGEKTPSFVVSPSRQTYHCFGCGAHGDAIRFLVEHGGMGFVEAVQDLAQQVGLKVPDDDRPPAERALEQSQQQRQRSLSDVLAKAAEHYRQQLKAHPQAIEYLKRRGLSGSVAATFGLGYAPDGWRSLASAFPEYDDPLLVEAGLVIAAEPESDTAEVRRYDRFRHRIMFPIRSARGDVIGFGGRVLDQGEPKYLNSPETPVFVKGRELYGLHEARSAIRSKGHALVVEGYMDVVALAQLGLPNAVATLGTACTADHVQKLFRFTESIVFSFDGDAAGRRAARRALEAALPLVGDLRSVRFLFLPTEHDPDSFIREHGPQAFEDEVGKAWSLSRMLVHAAQDDADPATPEGRARLLAQGRPLVALMPPGLLREQVTAELARHGGVASDALQAMWAAAEPPGTRRAAGDAGGGARYPSNGRSTFRPGMRSFAGRPLPRPTATALDRAAWLLLLRSDVVEHITGEEHELLADQPDPHGRFFAWMERTVHEHGPMAMPALLEHLAADAQAVAETELARRLAGLHDMDPAIDPAQEWRAAMRTLQLQAVNDELTLLIESGELSEAALVRRRELVDRRTLLKRPPASPTSAESV